MNAELIAKVKRTGERLETRVGHTEKRRHLKILSLLAFKALAYFDWTIDFQADSQESKERGLDNIWEHIAWHYPIGCDRLSIVQPTERQRWECVNEHVDDFKNGFMDLQRHLIDDHHLPLYMVPRFVSRRDFEVITISPDFKVNETETAKEVCSRRTIKQARGHIGSVVRKTTTLGLDPRAVFERVLSEALECEVSPPMMALEYSDSE
jgi:hypothetical protein